MTSKDGTSRAAVLAQIMAGACMVTALSLGGCDSATSEANKKAQKDAQEAARMTKSAGDIRPTEKFYTDLSAKGDKAAQDNWVMNKTNGLAAELQKDSEAAKSLRKQYFEQRSIAEDLKLSIEKLKAAANTPALSDPAIKSAIQAQMGSVAVGQAQQKLQGAERKFSSLVEHAIDIQNGALFLETLGKSAEVLEKRSQLTAASPGQKLTVAQAQSEMTKAQQVVTDLEQKIGDADKQATEIYAKTDAALAESDNMPGLQAIEHAKKAVEERKQADALRAEVATLQPQLSRAKMNLEVAKIRQADAESQSKSLAAIATRDQDAAKAASQQAAELRAKVQTLMREKGGVETQFEEFKTIAAELQKEADEAATAANTAVSAYKNAQSQWAAYSTEVTKLSDQPKFKALVDVVKAPETKQLLDLSEAAAHAEAGRAILLQVLAERYRTSAMGAMDRSRQAAGLSTATATTAPDESALVAKAKGEFTLARDIAGKVTTPAVERQKVDYEEDGKKKTVMTGPTLQWLAYTIKAAASHGIYTLQNDANDLKDAQAAAQKAQDINPFMPVSALMESPAQ